MDQGLLRRRQVFVCFCQVATCCEQRLIMSNVQTCSGTQILKCWSHSWRTHVEIVEAVMRPWKLLPSSFVKSRFVWMKHETLQFARRQGVLAWNIVALSACQVCLKPRVFDIKSTPPPKGFKDRLMQAQIYTVAGPFMWLQSPASWRVSAECHPGWQKCRPEGWTPHADKDCRFVHQMMTD